MMNEYDGQERWSEGGVGGGGQQEQSLSTVTSLELEEDR